MRQATSKTAGTVPPTSRTRRFMRLVWRIVRTPLVVYLCVVIMFMWLENSLIYFPSKYPDGDWAPRGIEVEDAPFRASDGTKLHGWYVPAEHPSAVVLFCHGNGGNLTHRADLMQAMQQYVGASILVFDYRGYGKSEGEPNEPGVLQDARAARAWLAERTGVTEKEIVLMGESLGGAVAVDLAANDGARALILEDTFTSLGDMAAYHYPWLPAKLLMKSRFNSLANIGRYHGPLLMTHGDADSIIPISYAQRLFAAANEPKQFIVDPGADHNDPRPLEFYTTLKAFLEHLPPAE